MIAKKEFGRTGHESTRTIFGAFALGTLTQKEADKTLEFLLEYGINHIDTAPSYDASEDRLGPWMPQHRKQFFLATKTDKRTYKEAKEELYRSLDRLKVDSVDLWQMHFLVNPTEWKTAMNEDSGVIRAFKEAKAEGLTKYLGVTGHGLAAPTMHMKSLEVYPFDSVLFPYNFSLMQLPEYAEETNKLLSICRDRNVAVQTIKSIAKGKLGDKKAQHNVWYEPITNNNALDLAVNWVLSNEQVFLNTSGDVGLMKKIVQAANKEITKPSEERMLSMLTDNAVQPLFEGPEV